jgi:hypothetical protein
MISPKARLKCACVKPNGANNNFWAISSRPDVDKVVGRADDESVEALRAEALEDRREVIRSL